MPGNSIIDFIVKICRTNYKSTDDRIIPGKGNPHRICKIGKVVGAINE